jgi:hypothetical protein
MIKVACTWGDGPDVLLCIYKQGKGGVSVISFDLTAEEAISLANELTSKAEQAKHLERVATLHDEQSKENL